MRACESQCLSVYVCESACMCPCVYIVFERERGGRRVEKKSGGKGGGE